MAKAYDVEIKDVYHPEVRPGYACWVSLWRAPAGELLIAFTEKRRAANRSYRPVPLDFYETMALPIKYQVSFCNGAPDILNESVIMRSIDEGESWEETGRSDTGGLMNLFAYASLPDGTILRGISTSYLSFTESEIPVTGIQKSTDGGTTWVLDSVLLEENFSGYIYRLKRLRDGNLAALCTYSMSFGPGRPVRQRGGGKPNRIDQGLKGLWISSDDGKNWTGPTLILPGIYAPEPDFIELPSGDLLVLNSSVQQGQRARQAIHRRKSGLLPGPVYKIVKGVVPETVCITKAGLLVGAPRGGPYVCSNDYGATWNEISGMPKCEYQPFIIELNDGRFLCAWHMHGDCVFGQFHQFVGQHVFSLDAARLPEAARLDITRDMNEEKTRYVNSYTAHLSANGRDLPNMKIGFHTQMRYRDTYDLSPPAPEPKEIIKDTDINGTASLDISELYPEVQREINIHQSYEIKAFFAPEEGGLFSTAESSLYRAYILTPEIGKTDSCPVYAAGRKLFVSPEVLKDIPEIKAVVEKISTPRNIDAEKCKKIPGLSDTRFEEIMEYLIEKNVLIRKSGGGYEWRYDLSLGCGEMEIRDDFI